MLSSSSSSSPSPRRRRARASASKSLARAPPRVEVADNTRARTAARGRAGRGRSRSVASLTWRSKHAKCVLAGRDRAKNVPKSKKNHRDPRAGAFEQSSARVRLSSCLSVCPSVLYVPRPMRDAAELTDIEPDDATVDPRAKINYDVRERCARRPTRVSRRPGRRLHRSVRRVNRADDGRGTTETDRTRATTRL